MNRLRLLKVYKSDISRTFEDTSKKANCKVHFSQDFKFHYDDLRLLYLHGYSLKSLPNDFNPKNLVDLSMPYSHIKHLWEGIKVLEKLKFMNLSHSKYLRETPDFSGVINLERLVLEGCISLSKVHPSLVVLNKLNFLSLRNCKMLRSLPSDIYKLKSLKTLDLSGCSNCENLKWLKELYADEGSLSASCLLPRNSINSICFMFPPLPDLCFLTKLNLSECNISDGANLSNLGFLSSLKSLNLSGNNFVTLPASISQLSQLKWLGLENCKQLEALWELPSSIEEINAYNCTSLTTLSSGFKLKGDPLLRPLELGSPESETDIPELLKASFSLFVPGRRIPDWIRYWNWGSEIEFELPPNWFNSNFLAFAFAVVYSSPLPLSHRSYGWVSADCNFFKSSDSSWHYAIYPQTTLRGGFESDHVWLLCVPFPPSINFDDVIRIKTSFDISLRKGFCAIKKCGIDLVYRNEEVNDNYTIMIQYISPPPGNSTLLLEETHEDDSIGSELSYDDSESENSDYYTSCEGETSESGWSYDGSESENFDYYSCEEETSEFWCSNGSESGDSDSSTIEEESFGRACSNDDSESEMRPQKRLKWSPNQDRED
ncbi:hypothetical protein PVL29_002496 [Vitis rotundifolia]|nr:hypothetical protein PVL29_002496 [Vitis rotundifolia]